MSSTNNTTSATVSTINIATQKAAVEAEYKAVIAGINSELASETSFVVNGTTFTKAELLARFQARLDAAERTKNDRTALHASVAAERQIATDAGTLRMGFKTWLQGRYGKNSSELQKFGFAQAKKPQRPVSNKSLGIAKNRATRTARSTVGKKQKLKIKGVVPVAPTAAPPAPKVSSGPAPTT
jgi:hypothetical protein